MADFPNSIFDPREVANVDGVVYEPGQTTRIFAEDVNKATAEIVAIETLLGSRPLGVPLFYPVEIYFPLHSVTGYLNSGFSSANYSAGSLVTGASPETQRYLAANAGVVSSGVPDAPAWELSMRVATSHNTSMLSYFGRFSFDQITESKTVSFKIENAILYALVDPGEDPTEVEITDVTVTSEHDYMIRFSDAAGEYYFYVDGVLRATIPKGSVGPNTTQRFALSTINTADSSRSLFFGDIVYKGFRG